MIPAAFDYAAPATVREAVALLRGRAGDARALAGGQSLIPMMRMRLVNPALVVDLSRVRGLAYVREHDLGGLGGHVRSADPPAVRGGLAIGAMTTYRTLETSSLVRERFPLLAEAVARIADLQVRNRGTIGGALAHADPSADLPALMVAADAVIRVSGMRSRSIAASRFFVDAFTTALGETEIITEVRLPALPARTGGAYEKLANRASHFAIVGVAALVTLDAAGACSRVRIGITGAGPAASRAHRAERYLAGRAPTEAALEAAAARAGHGIDFTDDLHGSAAYREHLTRRLAFRALSAAVERAG